MAAARPGQSPSVRAVESPLPASVEKAYQKKCIELRLRLNEVEAANDATRVRKIRLDRAIMKMRLERAFLLERLAKAQRLEDPREDESDASISPPATPQERAPRPKRRRGSVRSPPPPADPLRRFPSPQPLLSRHSNVSRSDGQAGGNLHHIHASPGNNTKPSLAPGLPARPTPPRLPTHLPASALTRRPPSEVPVENLPLINALPDGTQVIIDTHTGKPKEPPWTIRDVEPRHHLLPGFEDMTYEEQLDFCDNKNYEPFDLGGCNVNIVYDNSKGRMVHVFRGDPGWQDHNARDDESEMAGDRTSGSKREKRGRGRSPPSRDSQRAASSGSAGGFTAVNR